MSLSEERKRFLANDFSRGFIAFCGFTASDVGEGAFSSRLLVRPEHRQQDNFVHAGVMAAMADHTAGYAAYTVTDEDYRVLTIEFKINFFRPAAGGELRCEARVIRRGKLIVVAESVVFDPEFGPEKPAAKATVTMMPVPNENLMK